MSDSFSLAQHTGLEPTLNISVMFIKVAYWINNESDYFI